METKKFEIYWHDLNQEAKDRFYQAGFYDGNVDISPLAILELEPEEAEDEN